VYFRHQTSVDLPRSHLSYCDIFRLSLILRVTLILLLTLTRHSCQISRCTPSLFGAEPITVPHLPLLSLFVPSFLAKGDTQRSVLPPLLVIPPTTTFVLLCHHTRSNNTNIYSSIWLIFKELCHRSLLHLTSSPRG
jgi:hypothetical protein